MRLRFIETGLVTLLLLAGANAALAQYDLSW